MAITAMSSVTLPSPQTAVCLAVDTSAGGWAFGSPENAHFFLAADVLVDDTPPMPPNLASHRSPWQVGFIQNVLSETSNLTYDSTPPVSISVTQPCLDALADSSPWCCRVINNVLHYGRIQGVNSFWYQGPGKPVRFRISWADWPRFTVYNFFGGGSYPAGAGRQVRRVECTRHFRTWIAAREEMSPANQASSYVLLQMLDFAIKVTISLSPNGANPLFEREYRAAHAGTTRQLPAFAVLDVTAEYGTLAGGRFVVGPLQWAPPARGIQPVVVPPFANDYYPARAHAQNGNIGPQRIAITTVIRCL